MFNKNNWCRKVYVYSQIGLEKKVELTSPSYRLSKLKMEQFESFLLKHEISYSKTKRVDYMVISVGKLILLAYPCSNVEKHRGKSTNFTLIFDYNHLPLEHLKQIVLQGIGDVYLIRE